MFITNDVEGAGNRLGFYPTLSLGACVVTQDPITFETAIKDGLLFYAEIKPTSLNYNIKAMRVGCLHLMCLEDIREKDSRYDPTHENFNPVMVLKHMQDVCEEPSDAMNRFHQWVEEVSNGEKVEGVTDTVFYDGGHINLCFGVNSVTPSPFGHSGLDLNSLYRGYTGRTGAQLRELGVVDDREKPHRADHDAVYLAQIAQALLFEKLGW